MASRTPTGKKRTGRVYAKKPSTKGTQGYASGAIKFKGGSSSSKSSGGNAPNMSSMYGGEVYAPPPTMNAPNMSSMSGGAVYAPPPAQVSQGGMSPAPMQGQMSTMQPQQRGINDTLRPLAQGLVQTLGSEIDATTGFQIPGYTPDPNVTFTSPMAMPGAGVGKGILNSIDPLKGVNLARQQISAMKQGKQVKGWMKTGSEYVWLGKNAKNAEVIKKFVPPVGQVANAKTGIKAAFNTKNAKLVKKWVTRVGIGLGLTYATIGLAEKYISTQVFDGFIGNEAGQTADYNFKDAMKLGRQTGNYTLAEQLTSAVDELYEPSNFSALQKPFEPYLSAKENTEKHREIQLIVNEVNKGLLSIEKQAAAQGGVPGTLEYDQIKQEIINQEKFLQEEYLSNLWLQNRTIYLEREQAARAENRAADAAYWAEQREKSLEYEKELLRLQREYWEEVRKRSIADANERLPSKLNFGLL